MPVANSSVWSGSTTIEPARLPLSIRLHSPTVGRPVSTSSQVDEAEQQVPALVREHAVDGAVESILGDRLGDDRGVFDRPVLFHCKESLKITPSVSLTPIVNDGMSSGCPAARRSAGRRRRG